MTMKQIVPANGFSTMFAEDTLTPELRNLLAYSNRGHKVIIRLLKKLIESLEG